MIWLSNYPRVKSYVLGCRVPCFMHGNLSGINVQQDNELFILSCKSLVQYYPPFLLKVTLLLIGKVFVLISGFSTTFNIVEWVKLCQLQMSFRTEFRSCISTYIISVCQLVQLFIFLTRPLQVWREKNTPFFTLLYSNMNPNGFHSFSNPSFSLF